ncbi:MAG: DUF3570 domain-containing protein [Epsilonproteobacteria bacterium]|nr:DUF3570 domain-containing protein [Campylobacterota bacterium]
MQLRKLSFITCLALATTNGFGEDYVRVEVLQYNENDSRVSVLAPSIEVNKEFGTDYTLNVDLVADSVSGASPTYYDTASGASAYSRGVQNDPANIKKDNVNFEEQRTAIGVNLTTRFDSRDELQTGINISAEHDFYSAELSGSYLHYLDGSKNQSLTVGGSYQSNQILKKIDTTSGASEKLTSDIYNLQVGFSQVLNQKSVASIGLFFTNESGYLSSPYHNIVRNGNTIEAENKPDAKTGYGVKFGYQNALTDNLSSQYSYKFYSDNWGINSHTIDTQFYYDLSSKIILGGGLRYYTQTKADFYGENFTTEKFASSDERVKDFNAITYKGSIDYKINDKLSYNFGANLYDQSTGLQATTFTTGIKYKF